MVSLRELPRRLPDIDYPVTDQIRRVQDQGKISFKNRSFRVGRGFVGQPVGLRESEEDAVWDVYYCKQRVARIDLRKADSAQEDL